MICKIQGGLLSYRWINTWILSYRWINKMILRYRQILIHIDRFIDGQIEKYLQMDILKDLQMDRLKDIKLEIVRLKTPRLQLSGQNQVSFQLELKVFA